MKANTVHDFILRSGYPNYRYYELMCGDYFNGSASAPLPGYVAPEVDYIPAPGHAPVNVVVSTTDLPFLCDSDKEKSKDYLVHFINAKAGDQRSQQYIDEVKGQFFKELKERITSNCFVETKYVVPSHTTKKYNAGLISHKGSNLLAMTKDGYPVPDFCILTSKSYFLSHEKRSLHMRDAIANLEKLTGQQLGSETNPLIFAMRCALPAYIPGLMPTYLNVGVTEKIYKHLKKKFGNEVAMRIYHNNLKTIHAILCTDDSAETEIESKGISENEYLQKMIVFYHNCISKKNKKLLTDAYHQYSFFVANADEFYKVNQDLIFTFQKGNKVFPSLILHKMVWTVRDKDSYPGVLYSRHSRTGLGMQIESMNNIFGEDIMTGLKKPEDTEFFDREEIKVRFPAIYHFHPLVPWLEKKLKSPATIEFAAESFDDRHFFAVLQLDNSELTGRATLLSAIELFKLKIINKKRVVNLIQPYHLRQIFSERIDDESLSKLQLFSSGNSILPRSAMSAQLYFSATKVIEAKKRGEKVCFCKSTFNPTDRMVLSEIDTLLSLTPAAIHVVTACLGFGIPALINLENYNIKIEDNTLVNEQGVVIREGDWITISSRHKLLLVGRATYKTARFQKYLENQKLDMDTKEETVFINMRLAFEEYRKILESIQTETINNLFDLSKMIRNDFQYNPDKAKNMVNIWFDAHFEYYTQQILKSDLGSHADQHRLYELLTMGRRVRFFKRAIRLCGEKNLIGYKAGSFMLGRFIGQPHPVTFWKGLNAHETIFLLNEYVLFQKYMQLLYNMGEKHIIKAKNEILSFGLGSIMLSVSDAQIFTSLKLCMRDWHTVIGLHNSSLDKETKILLDLLQLPFGKIYNYDAPWSLELLEKICKNEFVALPDRESV